MRASRVGLLIAVTTLAMPNAARAQARASERGSASQTVDGTTITVEYGRPQVRGRTLFPRVVKWGEMWTPGANWATTIAADRPFTFGGQKVKPGTYSMWMVPSETGQWTVHLHPNPRLFHEAHPPASEMVLAVKVAPQVVDATEILTFQFPEVRRDATTLELRWGTTGIRVPIEVEPADDGSAFTAAEAEPVVGAWTMIFEDEKGDTTREGMTIAHKGKRLVVTMGGEEAFILVHAPQRRGVYYAAFVENDVVTNVEDSSPLTMKVVGGRATTITAAGARPGTTWFTAVRTEPRP
jgi:DUF2911 family protein